jgi:ribose 5-phosphate isomerase A
MTTATEGEKQIVAEAAAALVENGMRVGIGTGTTVAHLLPLLPGRGRDVIYVATSPQTEQAGLALGLNMQPFTTLDRLDLAIDGADQVAPTGWLIKGGGRAHTREKVVAAAAERFVVIVSADKLVTKLTPPIPLELLAFGLPATLRRLAPTELRGGPPSPDGGIIADYRGPVTNPARLAARLSSTAGVVDHGLFPPQLVSEILVGRNGNLQRLRPSTSGRLQQIV